MNTLQKGELATLKVIFRCYELGVVVSKPMSEGTGYDIITDDGGKLERAQVKYTGSMRQGCAVVTLHKSHRRSAALSRRFYAAHEIDTLFVYIPEMDRILKFPAEVCAGRNSLKIRLEPARNGQVKGCIYAADYWW